MHETETTMKSHQTAAASEPPNDKPGLDRKYGAIGISAVAAALRYQEPTTKWGRALSSDHLDDDWPGEAA
jgi:hypothetical protein